MRRVISVSTSSAAGRPVSGQVVLRHDERHLRRKLLHLGDNSMVMLDLKEAVLLCDGDLLEIDDGSVVQIVAAEEKLLEIRARDRVHLLQLAWHLGNRHLPAQIEDDRILVVRDHVIADMLRGLGAEVTEIEAGFQPVRGAYHAHGGQHGHG